MNFFNKGLIFTPEVFVLGMGVVNFDAQWKSCALPSSVQKFKLAASDFNQLSSLNSIIVQMSEKRDSSNWQ